MILGYKIFENTLESIDFDNYKIINTINPHSYCLSRYDKLFYEALQSSDILLPDGTGIVLASKIVNNKKINKIAGADIHQYLLQQANLKSQKVFYLGASQSTLELIQNKVKKEFPNITVSSFSPAYKPRFSDKETAQMLEIVNEFSPDILFVGMTAPKQEKWVFANKDNIDANIIVSIGAVFDFYAGTIKRPGNFWVSIGLEWLPRFLREPKRLARRNLVSTPKFLLEIIWYKIFGKGIL
ncbi:WecB/TagA/CpsF family glycosyltransferase [Flavobacteriaceae bacterium]|nr:WecB/TagA/CpsF family glycosyltransferase [Flavobacteriaceae bacterium]